MKKIFRSLSLVLIAVMLVTFINPGPESEAASSSELQNEIKKKQEAIAKSVSEKKKLQSKISDAKSIKKELEGLKSDVAAYITKLDSELELIERQIAEYDSLIESKEKDIEETTVELEDAKKKEEEQYEAMKQRIKFMYEQGDTFYMDIMLSAKSFGDFLTKADYVEQLSAYDRKTMDDYTKSREWTEVVKASLEAEKELLDQTLESKKEDEETVSTLLSEKEKQLNEYDRSIAAKQSEISAAEEELAAEQAAIAELEAQVAEAKKKLASSGKNYYTGGVFVWPCPGYIKISDDFGWRTDPITGASAYHSGLDMAAPAGSDILAACDGVVVACTYHWSMGNYVMIDHGSGLYTIYMHTSKFYVSLNQTVNAGDVIAAVGTTGRSTGNHLHFGVRKDGVYVSPWDYLK